MNRALSKYNNDISELVHDESFVGGHTNNGGDQFRTNSSKG